MTGERLLVFVKAPRPGSVKTRLAKDVGAESACAAYRRIAGELFGGLRGLDAVELCYTPADAGTEIQSWMRDGWAAAPQGGGDLGQRLNAAFERAFKGGAARVVVIGSDCPGVTAADIREAWEGLKTHDVVLGPATDGGYWLIGLRQVCAALFQGIPWSSADVFRQTMERIREQGRSVQFLRELADVDTERDWRAYLASQSQARP